MGPMENIEREFPDFYSDERDVRFCLSTDRLNPFGDMGCSHSTWICLKRKFIMMPILFQGPKKPGNNIDVCRRLLVDHLLNL